MLHVLIGPVCNNHCIFCMESDREARLRAVSGQTTADLRAMLETYEGRDEVLFTSGEPTLNPALPELIEAAKALGYETIGVISNGRRFAYADYARKLLEAGLNKLTLSIHGHEARVHDAQTRTRGSFDQAHAGIKNLVALRRVHRFDLMTSTVVTARTLPHLADIHAFLMGFDVDCVVLNVLMARGVPPERYAKLMRPYQEIIAGINALLEGLPEDQRAKVRVVDAPACVTTALPSSARGGVESYDQFERRGSTGFKGKEVPLTDTSTDEEGFSEIRELITQTDVAEDNAYYLVQREQKDGYARVKRRKCTRCRHEASCEGVWEPYLDRYGWDEFEPIP